MLAVSTAGGAYLPLDPAYPQQRLAHMLADAAPALILRTAAVTLPGCQIPEAVLDDPAIADELSRLPCNEIGEDRRPRPDNLLYLIYTSGSTGTPKGVAVTHGGIAGLLRAQTEWVRPGPGDRVLQWASYNFDAAFWDTTLALLTGATLVMATAEDLMPGEDLWRTLRDRRITHATLPPVALSVTDSDGVLDGGVLVSTGDACSPALVEKWAHGRRMYNGYGPTEMTIGATLDGPLRPGAEISIGIPWPDNAVHVLDDRLRPVHPGTDGELYLAGSGIARGYFDLPGRTAMAFLPDPFGDPGSRMYRSGDRGRRGEDGRLYFGRRLDEQIKVRGFRVELGEIESYALRLPEVEIAAAIVCGSLEDAHIVVFARLATDSGLDGPAIRRHLAASLPDHLVPTKVVCIERFPMTNNGKIDRRRLGEHETGLHHDSAPENRSSRAAPTSLDRLCALAAAVLQVAQVTAADNFFALGGQSVQAARFAQRIRAELGVEKSLRMIFATASMAELASALDLP
jgi:amino acid adenylation domain-containing protein